MAVENNEVPGKVIYGDGHTEVKVVGGGLIIMQTDEPEPDGSLTMKVIAVSRATFREIVLGYERFCDVENDTKPPAQIAHPKGLDSAEEHPKLG